MNNNMKLLGSAVFSVALLSGLPAVAADYGTPKDGSETEMRTMPNTGQHGESPTTERQPATRDQGDEVEAGTTGMDNSNVIDDQANEGVGPNGPDGVNGGGATAQ